MSGTFARGFSLIEVMVVVAIIAVLAAIAVPNLLPEVHKAHVNGAAEVVAATLGRARAEAMLSKRCVRVYVNSNDDGVLVAERLNTFDCDVTPAVFPTGWNGAGLDGTNRVWSPLSTTTVDSQTVQLALTPPSDTAACSTQSGSSTGVPAGFACSQLIFRPNGRLWTTDPDPDDDAVITVSHPGLPQAKRVLINSNGLICAYRLGDALLPGVGVGDFVCPP